MLPNSKRSTNFAINQLNLHIERSGSNTLRQTVIRLKNYNESNARSLFYIQSFILHSFVFHLMKVGIISLFPLVIKVKKGSHPTFGFTDTVIIHGILSGSGHVTNVSNVSWCSRQKIQNSFSVEFLIKCEKRDAHSDELNSMAVVYSPLGRWSFVKILTPIDLHFRREKRRQLLYTVDYLQPMSFDKYFTLRPMSLICDLNHVKWKSQNSYSARVEKDKWRNRTRRNVIQRVNQIIGWITLRMDARYLNEGSLQHHYVNNNYDKNKEDIQSIILWLATFLLRNDAPLPPLVCAAQCERTHQRFGE